MRAQSLTNVAIPLSMHSRQRTSDSIADALREAIRIGDLPDGTELSQVALAERFGVSRIPIREAMSRLEAEGWITAMPHRSAVVRGLDRERLLELIDLRILLETHLVERTIAEISERRVDELERLCDEMDWITDRREWLTANNAFHLALAEPSRAVATISMLEQVTAQASRYVRASGNPFKRAPGAVDEHRSIVHAVRRRDAVHAQKLLRAHIEVTRDYTIQSLKAAEISEKRSSEERKT